MPTVLGSLLLGGPLACGSPSSLESAPEPCVRVYHATVQSLKPLLLSSGVPEPAFPPQQDYVSRCQALPLPPESLPCLDPAIALVERARCAEPLAHPEVRALSEWFAAQVLPGDPEPGPSPTAQPPMVQPTAKPAVPVDEPPSPNPIGGPP